MKGDQFTMPGLIMKLFLYPVIVLLSDAILGNVNYENIYQPVTIGLFLALLAHVSELFSLRRGTFWINNVIDFTVAFLVVYFSRFVYTGALITFTGAVITAILLAVSEYFQHLYLIRIRLAGK